MKILHRNIFSSPKAESELRLSGRTASLVLLSPLPSSVVEYGTCSFKPQLVFELQNNAPLPYMKKEKSELSHIF